ncbi:PH domain-containing protein [Fodinicola feengrottensis]|uniref:Low molecular weight protein antigen 6 PH domain-containing protein n=1 Tax=Fodinicola feengrottensis TaxID=435914 RepID=A0ABN2IIY1_9ACTN|nr:PH domain-containing protein [Fodinicola feengrottensis]
MPSEQPISPWLLRPRPIQLLPSVATSVVAVALLSWLFGRGLGVLGFILCAVFVARDAIGATVSSDGIRVRGVVRSKLITWRRIERIEAPGNRVSIAGMTWATTLPAPRKGMFGDPDFDSKVAQLRDTWRANLSD